MKEPEFVVKYNILRPLALLKKIRAEGSGTMHLDRYDFDATPGFKPTPSPIATAFEDWRGHYLSSHDFSADDGYSYKDGCLTCVNSMNRSIRILEAMKEDIGAEAGAKEKGVEPELTGERMKEPELTAAYSVLSHLIRLKNVRAEKRGSILFNTYKNMAAGSRFAFLPIAAMFENWKRHYGPAHGLSTDGRDSYKDNCQICISFMDRSILLLETMEEDTEAEAGAKEKVVEPEFTEVQKKSVAKYIALGHLALLKKIRAEKVGDLFFDTYDDVTAELKFTFSSIRDKFGKWKLHHRSSHGSTRDGRDPYVDGCPVCATFMGRSIFILETMKEDIEAEEGREVTDTVLKTDAVLKYDDKNTEKDVHSASLCQTLESMKDSIIDKMNDEVNFPEEDPREIVDSHFSSFISEYNLARTPSVKAVDKHFCHKDEAYLKLKVEPIDAIFSMGLGKDYCLGNIIKYAMRCRYKGQTVDDLKKARTYLNWLIELEEKEESH